MQGLCLPFRGFSRSGATISTGLLLGLDKTRVEEFSFALAVVLTPAVILKESYRLLEAHESSLMYAGNLLSIALPSLAGMVFSFVAGLMALQVAFAVTGPWPMATSSAITACSLESWCSSLIGFFFAERNTCE